MKYYERLNPLERKRLVLCAAAFDAAMEGMDGAKASCLKALRDLDTPPHPDPLPQGGEGRFL
ncbi:MAG: hypothetical protein OEL53_01495 [Rhodospirillales bacterium]|nr:hypothetical protein [Rhodospirillales bacterium]